ncbi:MAG: hypothetical protein CMK09_15100 [Ponticaulis sp.]|nr:hypothetical protein [Ponticaulis sp.]|tara:strand:+ start:32860 stop:33195 length:336 start_codon:yes stop_codon:yes gene_type:complete
MKRILAAALVAGLSFTAVAQADSFNNFSEAVGDSAEAGSRVVAAGGQVALGAVAVPLAAVGAVVEGAGDTAGNIANDMWGAANTPLQVSDEVVVAQPAPTLNVTVNVEGED